MLTKAGFSAFLSHRKFELDMEMSWKTESLNFIAQFLCEPCLISIKEILLESVL